MVKPFTEFVSVGYNWCKTGLKKSALKGLYESESNCLRNLEFETGDRGRLARTHPTHTHQAHLSQGHPTHSARARTAAKRAHTNRLFDWLFVN